MNHSQGASALDWQVAPEVLIPLALLAYLRWKRGGRRLELVWFALGLLSVVAVVQSPVGTRASDYFTLHMIQHITLMMIAGPLLVLGTPRDLKLSGRAFEIATHPIISWVLYAALMVGVHLPTIHDFIMANPWAHRYVEVPLYLILPYLFYYNLLDRKLKDRRVSPALSVISLFIMMIPETLTGFFIYASPHSLYDNMYTMSDQQRGGSFMWAGSMIIDTLWMALAVHHWMKSEEARGREIDAEIAQEKP